MADDDCESYIFCLSRRIYRFLLLVAYFAVSVGAMAAMIITYVREMFFRYNHHRPATTQHTQDAQLGKALLWTAGFFYVFVPALILSFPPITNYCVFLHFIHDPRNNYSDLASGGVRSPGRSFRLESSDGVSLGAWHVLPRSLAGRAPEEPGQDHLWEHLIAASDRPVLVYLHGTSATRMCPHRVWLYNRLAEELDFHVLAIDYRGYADSQGWPTEDGVIRGEDVEDAMAAIRYAMRLTGEPRRVIVWGHSLGTTISTSAVGRLGLHERPRGLILESPFDRLENLVRGLPQTAPWKVLPDALFHYLLVRPALERGFTLHPAQAIAKVEVPIMILMAEDDEIIPFQLAVNLRDAAEAAGKQLIVDVKPFEVKWVAFPSSKRYRHIDIWKAPELPHLVRDFLQ